MLFKSTDTNSPRSLRDVPAFVDAEARRDDLQTQSGATRDELLRVRKEIHEARARQTAGVGAVAEALANGASWEKANAHTNSVALEEQLGELQQREAVLLKAVGIAERRLSDARRDASVAVYETHRAEHTRHVRATLAGLIAFLRGMEAERTFRGALEGEGVVGIPATGSRVFDEMGSSDGRGAFGWYIRELAECGFITNAELAAVLKGETFTP